MVKKDSLVALRCLKHFLYIASKCRSYGDLFHYQSDDLEDLIKNFAFVEQGPHLQLLEPKEELLERNLNKHHCAQSC